MFARLGTWCYRRRRSVAVLWLLAAVVLGGVSGALGTESRDEFSMPDVESRTGSDILNDEFGGQGAGITGSVVFVAEQGVDDPQVKAAMEALFAELDGRDDLEVSSPYAEGGQRQVASRGDLAGKLAYAEVEMPDDIAFEDSAKIADEIMEIAPELDGLRIELGGQAFAEFEAPDSEVLGLAFAVVILIISFGSVLAMGLPIGVALAGITIGSILVTILSNVMSMPDFASVIGVMIGLGVGIDYALFIVTRFRENLGHGHTIEEAVAVAMDTAGRAVLFAGATVVVSFLGMLIMDIAFVTGLAVAAATVVLATIVASLTLLPALLGFAGQRLEVTRWRGLIAAGLVAVALVGVGLKLAPLTVGLPLAAIVLAVSFLYAPLRREVPRPAKKPIRQTTAYRWSRLIQHHPWPAAIGGALLLLVLAIPVLSLRLSFSDEGNYPEDTTTRQAYDLLAEGFGPGFNGPFVLAALLPEGTDAEDLAPVAEAVQADEGVAFVSPAIVNESGTAALWRVIPTSAPQDEETTGLVHRLRDHVLPPAEAATGTEVNVTGSVAVNVDFSSYLAGRLPWFFGAVLTISFLLLMTVFRSLLVPLKAVIMNLLSIGAAYGIVVAIFQWGWLGDLFGVAPAPVEPFIPMMLFAIVFGLSMDYEVFLLSRVKEEWNRTQDSHESVANGLAQTARVISAAAAIMVFIFFSFLLETDRVIKLFGMGLGIAVLLDATVVRMLLVPATMELLGDRNWWLPKWLDRILPTIDVEGHPDEIDDFADEVAGGDDDLQRDLEPEPV